MNDQQTIDAYLRKAQESLESAESEYANRRYNSCASGCYYACFQAAVAALLSPGSDREIRKVGGGMTTSRRRSAGN